MRRKRLIRPGQMVRAVGLIDALSVASGIPSDSSESLSISAIPALFIFCLIAAFLLRLHVGITAKKEVFP